MSSIQIVTIKSPVENLNNPVIAKLFTKILNLKMDGYRAVEEQFLPFDTYDYIATHVVACAMDDAGELNPVLAFRGITKKVCNFWKKPFPGEKLCDSSQSERHKQSLQKWCAQYGDRISYIGSLSLSPNVIKRNERLQLLQMFCGLTIYYHELDEIERSVFVGRPKTKSDQIFLKAGAVPLYDNNGGRLGKILSPDIINEEVEIFLNEKGFSPMAIENAKQIRPLWRSRINEKNIIDDQTSFPLLAVA